MDLNNYRQNNSTDIIEMEKGPDGVYQQVKEGTDERKGFMDKLRNSKVGKYLTGLAAAGIMAAGVYGISKPKDADALLIDVVNHGDGFIEYFLDLEENEDFSIFDITFYYPANLYSSQSIGVEQDTNNHIKGVVLNDGNVLAIGDFPSTLTEASYTYLSSYNGCSFEGQGNVDVPAPVPEPASILLFGSGLTVLGIASRRKKKKE